MAKMKKSDFNAKEPKKRTLWLVKLTDSQTKNLGKFLEGSPLFIPYETGYANFAYKNSEVNIVSYISGKLLIQGKGTEDFVRYILEPKITFVAEMGYEEQLHPEWFEAHAGLDESGKGDLFGPLVSACVIADGNAVRKWIDGNLKESKSVTSDNSVLRMEKMIRETEGVVVSTCFASMEKYNSLYLRFGNLNDYLGWCHATSLKEALSKRKVEWGMLDQFSRQPIVQKQLKIEGFNLKMQTKAEADPVVAAASIIARAAYIKAMRKLSSSCGMQLCKGSSADARQQAAEIVKKFGAESLKKYAKLHFRTATEAVALAEVEKEKDSDK